MAYKTSYMKYKLFILILLMGASCAPEVSEHEVTEKNAKQLVELEWMIGRWENHSGEGILSEMWERENDSVFSGVSFYVIGSDTVFQEKIRLESTEGEVYYKPQVDGQNEGKQVVFTQTFNDKMKWVFENPKHDFPQKITYTHRNDSLIAVISGIRNGKPGSEVFAMKRMK